MKLLLLTLLLLGAAILLLGVKTFFVRGGRFPSGHAHEVMARYGTNRRKNAPADNDNKQTKHIKTS